VTRSTLILYHKIGKSCQLRLNKEDNTMSISKRFILEGV